MTGPEGLLNHAPDIDAAAGSLGSLTEGVEETHGEVRCRLLVAGYENLYRAKGGRITPYPKFDVRC
jgi:hypothetical protein